VAVQQDQRRVKRFEKKFNKKKRLVSAIGSMGQQRVETEIPMELKEEDDENGASMKCK